MVPEAPRRNRVVKIPKQAPRFNAGMLSRRASYILHRRNCTVSFLVERAWQETVCPPYGGQKARPKAKELVLCHRNFDIDNLSGGDGKRFGRQEVMDTIFTLKNEDLERLNPKQAVDFFRELLWAEATVIGVGKNLINVPSAITVADGGVDAEVKDVQITAGQGIIKQGLTRYQIKTGGFSLSGDSEIKKVLFKDN